MKRIYALLILTSMLLTLCLSSCTPQPAYEPAGEVYAKTSPARGDGGVSEVVDITVEKAVYAASGDVTIPVRIGLGHHHWPLRVEDGPGYAWLEIKLRTVDGEGMITADTLRLDYPDWETAKFDATEPEERPWYLITFPYYYGDFYPLYHDTVEWNIPADAIEGRMEVCLYEVEDNGNEYTTQSVRLWFERVDGELLFAANN